jgi:aerobic carbon-monoxide dehydrogenase large subunit
LRGPQTEPIEASVIYTAPHEAWSSGCAVTSVSVDAETGELEVLNFVWVDDAGVVINPQLVEGQLLGGLAQGLGQVLCERIHYDDDGQLLTGSLMDYAVMRADQMPRVELRSIHSATDANALGAKGVGESGCIVAPAAVFNAALDALAPLGVTDLPIPLTSENIWLAVRRH